MINFKGFLFNFKNIFKTALYKLYFPSFQSQYLEICSCVIFFILLVSYYSISAVEIEVRKEEITTACRESVM